MLPIIIYKNKLKTEPIIIIIFTRLIKLIIISHYLIEDKNSFIYIICILFYYYVPNHPSLFIYFFSIIQLKLLLFCNIIISFVSFVLHHFKAKKYI